jgi:hypothetical protein
MRIGSNPEKTAKVITVENYHRVVIPVYIPNFEGYFKDAFDIFKLCLESLLLTIHSKTRITIYNNNCHVDVKNYIDKKFNESNYIDQVFHSKENLGKINAILAASKGNLEPLITITDADVLFKNGWQESCEEVFVGFPEAGMVSPVPNPKFFNAFNANNWFYGITKGKLRFEKVQDPDGVIKFYKSLSESGTAHIQAIHLEQFLVLENSKQNCKAVMGCGHFVATMRREVFDYGTHKPAFIKIVGGVEIEFIDMPNENLGYLRLATQGNYAFHMGNSLEDWMFDEFKKLHKYDKNRFFDIPYYPPSRISIIGKYISKIVRRPLVKKALFKMMGLSRDYIKY